MQAKNLPTAVNHPALLKKITASIRNSLLFQRRIRVLLLLLLPITFSSKNFWWLNMKPTMKSSVLSSKWGSQTNALFRNCRHLGGKDFLFFLYDRLHVPLTTTWWFRTLCEQLIKSFSTGGPLDAMRHFSNLRISGGRKSTSTFFFVSNFAGNIQMEVKFFEPIKSQGQYDKLSSGVINFDEILIEFAGPFRKATSTQRNTWYCQKMMRAAGRRQCFFVNPQQMKL